VQLGPDNRRRIRFDALSKLRPHAKLVVHDNPYFLNERLTAHQGVFLFAGDIRRSFRENLKAMEGWQLKENVFKLYLDFDINRKKAAVTTLRRMNVSSTVLFPGLDGFARSLGEELPFYDEIYGTMEAGYAPIGSSSEMRARPRPRRNRRPIAASS
jgi:hypothetical protein